VDGPIMRQAAGRNARARGGGADLAPSDGPPTGQRAATHPRAWELTPGPRSRYRPPLFR
jgi:hypothetical protein